MGLLRGVAVGCVLLGVLGTGAFGQTKKKHAATGHTTAGHTARKSTTTKAGASSHGTAHRTTSRSSKTKGRAAGPVKRRHIAQVKETAESKRLRMAFVASAQLRPMAQQLIKIRSAAAYAGVKGYAASHPGDAAAAAELALGHAYMLDHRYDEAEESFRAANAKGAQLDDYAEYLQAQAAVAGNRPGDAVPLLKGFGDRHPGSVFATNAPVLLAQAYLENNDPGDALRLLEPLAPPNKGEPAVASSMQAARGPAQLELRMTLAKAYLAASNVPRAAELYRGVYLGNPVSSEAATAKTQLAAMGVGLTAVERKQHADSMFNAGQYAVAAEEYYALRKSDAALSEADKNALEIYAAVCDLRLKKLGRRDVERLPMTGDDSAALKMYLESELARNEGNAPLQDALTQQMIAKYPQSRWLEEALHSGGNMYLIARDQPNAIKDFVALVEHFPHSMYAPTAHWRAAWLSYRLRRYPDAARLMDEQVQNYPASGEVAGALYWRGRLYEDVEHDFGQALNYYSALNAAYVNSYYAMLGRQRMSVIGKRDAVTPAPVLASVKMVVNPELTDELPENDPHLIKARLLANAGLNEYIRPEIELSATAGEWGALAEAQIYESFGEDSRALQSMKRSKIPYLSLTVDQIPMAYWKLIFPKPYWGALTADARENGLDPFLVASLIRQESEFNPNAVSRANAYGLMQLLPSTAKGIAKRQGNRHFQTGELLNPETNLKLGTADLRSAIAKYGGQVEYALASYNAGDTPVRQWIAENNYKDLPEWVESIPYTETREYVEAIVRNRELYRALYGK
ncbi:MAG: transglycosylase SLT domain-containing protein [Acidobacteriota bacterium]